MKERESLRDASPTVTETRTLLGIDIGTTRVKALLIDLEGRVRGMGVCETPFETTGPHVEMTLFGLKTAIGTAVGQLGGAVTHVSAVGIASMGETGVPLDRHLEPSGPLIAWHDSRGAKVVRRLIDEYGDALPARAGQITRVQSSIAKIGWLLQHDVEIHRWLGAAEAALWSLTGEQVSEPSLACRTGAFDVSALSYLGDVIRLVGAPHDIFPPVRVAGEPHGRVTDAGREWLGLAVGVPVTVAGHDHMVGAVGVGLSDDDLLDSIGTAETLVRYTRDDLDFIQAATLMADVSIDPARGGLAVMAGDLRPGRIVESARRMFGDASFEELDGAALSVDSGMGEIHAAEGAVLLEQLRLQAGPGVSSGSAQVRWRGLIEAMTSYMWNCALGIEPLAEPPARIVLIGGGARSDTWASAKRRISGLPVARSLTEATAYGAALFAGCAAGYWPVVDEAPRSPLERVEQ